MMTLALLLGLSGQPTVSPAAGMDVDVALVLAVDMSGSMDADEARVQRLGYIEALRHPDFIRAVTGGLEGRIGISYFEWAGSVNETSVVPWHVIANADDAAAFADRLASRPVFTRRGTSISNAIRFGARLFASSPYTPKRRVIDVSGDGPNNLGPPVEPARNAAVARGITVNGLAILIRPSGLPGALDRYYADCVIGGPGAFVLPVHRTEDFTTAIRQKLVLEVSGTKSRARPVPASANQLSDCMIGEKLRPGFLDRAQPQQIR